MKAIICTKYGLDGLKLEDVPQPDPGDAEILVKVYASSVTTHNLAIVTGKPFLVRLMGSGLLRPKIKIPGSDLAGRVEAVGRNVKQFHTGDDVYGDISDVGFGAFSEYICAPENVLALKPSNISYEEAAAVPQAALVALQGLRDKGQIQKGQKVLIYGASGGIGTFAVQIAKTFGAEVTGVCSKKNLELVRSLGADRVIDYMKEDFARNGQRYDLIFNIRGYRSIFDYRGALSNQGVYVSTGGPSMSRIFQDMLLGPLISKNRGKKLVGGWVVKLNQKDLIYVKELIEAGKVRPVIDRSYPLEEVAGALRYYGEGHARGKVVISMEHIDLSRRSL
jgi:NADPH:quinone reductase-like Zn-dependent oxidoreductase